MNHGGVLKVTIDVGSDGCEDCRLLIYIYNPKDNSCYFYTGDYDRLSANTNYQWTGESLNYGQTGNCDAWLGGNPVAGGWRMRITYYTTDDADTLRLSRGEVFFLSDDGSGARLSCPMEDHLFDHDGDYAEYFDCYWTM